MFGFGSFTPDDMSKLGNESTIPAKDKSGWEKWQEMMKKKKEKNSQEQPADDTPAVYSEKPPLSNIAGLSTIGSGQDDLGNYLKWVAMQDRFKEMSQF